MLFFSLLGSLDCTGKPYMPPCRGKFALPVCSTTVSKIGQNFNFPLYYLIQFSCWKPGFSEFGNKLLAKIAYKVQPHPHTYKLLTFPKIFKFKKPRQHVIMHDFEISYATPVLLKIYWKKFWSFKKGMNFFEILSSSYFYLNRQKKSYRVVAMIAYMTHAVDEIIDSLVIALKW